MDSSTAPAPSSTVPSTGIFSPGRTRSVSPACTCASSTSASLPSGSIRCALRGTRSSSARSAAPVFCRARSSSTWPSSTSVTIIAADSKYRPVDSPWRKACGTSCGTITASALKPYATATPSAISVNMLKLRERSDRQPRCSSGAPHQRTTGVASANCSQPLVGPASGRGNAPSMPPIASVMSGTVKTTAHPRRRRMSTSSGSSPAVATGTARSSAMPHLGQAPGTGLSTPGHIGQI